MIFDPGHKSLAVIVVPIWRGVDLEFSSLQNEGDHVMHVSLTQQTEHSFT